jgi:predicted unusual protein kinase regulating ubiquinone biosynthesis (AarF/ABC1/UbiB family)
MRMSGLLPKGFDLAPYLSAAREQLHEETDYVREGAQLERFGKALADLPHFMVPALHGDWTTPDILAMSFVTGRPIEEAAQEPQDVRDLIATRLIDLTLTELFELGFMQTDPNFANYLFDSASQQIVLLDFGATRTLDSGIVDQYRRLMRAGLADDTDMLTQVSGEIGFFGPDTADVHRRKLVQLIRLVFGALRDVQPMDFADTRLPQDLQAKGMELADDGFVPPPLPIDVLLLQRKFGGIFLLAARLGARVDVAALLNRVMRQAQDRAAS